MRGLAFLLVLPAIVGCVNALPPAASDKRPIGYKASVIMHSMSAKEQVVDLTVGQPYSVTGNGYRITAIHNRRSMVSNADNSAAEYREYEINGNQARSALHDLTNEPNRVANYVKRVVVFADPIQSAGDVDRVFLEAFCERAVECLVAERVAATVRFTPLS